MRGLGFFRKKLRNDGLTAVVVARDRGHIVTVARHRARAPRVIFHHVLSPGSDAADLRRALERGAAKRFPAGTLLDRNDYQLLLVEAPDVRPDELRAAIRWRIRDLVGFHIDDAVIDVFEIPGQRHANRNRMMYAVAARSRRVTERAQMLDDAGLHADVVDIPEMALRNFATLLPEESRGIALIHLIADGGVIIVSRQGTLFLARRLDVGMRALQDADGDEQSRLCEGVLLEVQRSLDYYESHFPHGPVGAIALTPTAAATALAGYLPRRLETPILMPQLEDLLEFDAMTGEPDGEFILALGAALRHETRSP